MSVRPHATGRDDGGVAVSISGLQAIAALHGAKVTHMKPHGMMANMSADNAEMAEAMARATKAVDRDLIFLCQANTEQGKAARKYGLRAAEEVFADRTYTDSGMLTPRKEPNSMIKDPAQADAGDSSLCLGRGPSVSAVFLNESDRQRHAQMIAIEGACLPACFHLAPHLG